MRTELQFNKDGRIIVPRIKIETKSERRKRLRRAFQQKRIFLIEKHKNAENHNKPWTDEELKDVIINCKRNNLNQIDMFATEYKREFGSIEWICDIRDSLLKGIEKKSNPLEKDKFARQINRLIEN